MTRTWRCGSRSAPACCPAMARWNCCRSRSSMPHGSARSTAWDSSKRASARSASWLQRSVDAGGHDLAPQARRVDRPWLVVPAGREPRVALAQLLVLLPGDFLDPEQAVERLADAAGPGRALRDVELHVAVLGN